LCIINGRVIGVSNKAIVLIKAGESFRFEGIDIPIKEDSTFHYEFNLNSPEGCTLFLDNIRTKAARPMTFFLEPGEINITVYPEKDVDKNIVEGGKFNKEYKEYETRYNQEKEKYKEELSLIHKKEGKLREEEKYYSEEMNNLNKQINEVATSKEFYEIYDKQKKLREQRLDLSPEARLIADRYSEFNKDMKKWKYNYIKKNPSIISYYLLVEDLQYSIEIMDIKEAKEIYKKLANKFPNHPYNEYAKNRLLPISVGNKYIDFIAPDVNGNMVKLSEKINGKVAVIDLWASWCSPCIQRSKQLLPIYEEFKDKGLFIIGLANEYKNLKAFQERLKKDEYPWINLVDLDEKYKIAEKYQGGNKILLIDKDGTILAINPSPEEIRNILEVKL